MAKSIFITGTGTDVGKNFVTGQILRKLKENGINAAYYKAAMSGCRMEEDNLRMCEYRTKLLVLACVEDGSEELEIEIERLISLYEKS